MGHGASRLLGNCPTFPLTESEKASKPGKAKRKKDKAATRGGDDAGCLDKPAPVHAPTRSQNLQALEAPDSPRKTKGETLNSSQRTLLKKSLSSMGESAYAKEVARVKPGTKPHIKEPSVLEFVGANGEPQRWFISKMVHKGTFGKFRVAVLDTPDGQPTVVKAVKEYRLNERKDREQIWPSANQRKKAWDVARYAAAMFPAARKDAQQLVTWLDGDEPLSPSDYHDLVDVVMTRAQREGRPFSKEQVKHLRLDTKTDHISLDEVEAENALFALTDSVLRVRESVQRDGRVYNFSELMVGEFFEVARSTLLSEKQRVDVSRHNAREAFGRLIEMHDKHIAHRDLKPENIFIDQQGNAQLGDWNMALQLENRQSTELVGTEVYLPPEVLAQRPYGKECDIYSMGLTIAASAMRGFIVHNHRDQYYQDRRSPRTKSVAHEALRQVIDRLTFTPDGEIEQACLAALEDFPRYKLREYTPEIALRVANVMEGARCFIVEWSRIDPKLCGVVLNHMLRHDPAQRSDAKTIEGLLAQIQPAGSAGAHSAQQVIKNIMQRDTSISGEIELVKAYGRAYKRG